MSRNAGRLPMAETPQSEANLPCIEALQSPLGAAPRQRPGMGESATTGRLGVRLRGASQLLREVVL
eukprot:12199635-Alexandrium_andersonii.AAC.1